MRNASRTSINAQEARLAIFMLIPAFLIVFLIILFPVVLNFWISFKPVELADLRAPTPMVREEIVIRPEEPGDELILRYRIRNSSQQAPIPDVRIEGTLPAGLEPTVLPDGFTVDDRKVIGVFAGWEPGFSDDLELRFRANNTFVDSAWRDSATISFPKAEGRAVNKLFNFSFTLHNYGRILSSSDFWPTLVTTFAYTFFGAVGAIILGLLAAQLVNGDFRGKSLVRGLLLFPYVAPVISVAFAWTFFLDPFSGTLNALLIDLGVIDNGIGFLSERNFVVAVFGRELRLPLALTTVIIFDAWRYFPFAFLFILARLQAVPSALYESADIDGANPYQKFFRITVPQVAEVIGTLFLLRFMWTFNKFDDVFLLTGGAAGTKTLPIQVYDNAFGRADIGAGAAASVLLFIFLALFLIVYFRNIREVES